MAKLLQTEVMDKINLENDSFLKTLEEEDYIFKSSLSRSLTVNKKVLESSIESVMSYFNVEILVPGSTGRKTLSQKLRIRRVSIISTPALGKTKSSVSFKRLFKFLTTKRKIIKMTQIDQNV